MKKCIECNTNKELTEFYKAANSKDGHRSSCKECKDKKTLVWRAANPKAYNALAVKWRDNNPDKQHANEIKRRYGLSLEDYNALLVKQNMCCALCDVQHDTSKKRGRLYVDHDHETGKVRALLCHNHNVMLGHAEDSIETLEKAIKYLKQHADKGNEEAA